MVGVGEMVAVKVIVGVKVWVAVGVEVAVGTWEGAGEFVGVRLAFGDNVEVNVGEGVFCALQAGRKNNKMTIGKNKVSFLSKVFGGFLLIFWLSRSFENRYE